MEAFLVRRLRVTRDRSRRLAWALSVGAAVFALTAPVNAQSLDSQPPRTPAHQDSPRRARTLRPERNTLAQDAKRDYADPREGGSFAGGIDVVFLEARIRDLTAKVQELTDLLQREREAAEPVRFTPRPRRVTLLERHEPSRIATTYGEALDVVVRDHARAIRAAFDDREDRKRLAIDPQPDEVGRLLEPIHAGLLARETTAEVTYAQLRALVYATLLEARAKIDPPEPLPVVHKMLRDLHVDRTALTEHLRRSFLLDGSAPGRDLGAVLAATATAYPEPSGMRDFLVWLADSVGADLKDVALQKAAYSYREDAQGQFAAAAENATHDNGDVLKLQVELQRMLVEAKALRAASPADEGTGGAWQHRLLQAERELDRLVRAADSEREAVMTLARRHPMEKKPITVVEPAASLSIEPAQAVASDDLTTQH